MAEKVNIRNTLKFWGAPDDQVNRVKYWGPSYEDRGGEGYADEGEIKNYYSRSHGLAAVRNALTGGGYSNDAIGYDFGANKPTLQGRIADFGPGSINLGGNYYARPEEINKYLGPALSPKMGGALQAVQNAGNFDTIQNDPTYKAYMSQMKTQMQDSTSQLKAQLASQGMFGAGSGPAMHRFTDLQDDYNRRLETETIPTVMNTVMQRNMGVLNATQGAESNAQDQSRRDADYTGYLQGQPTMALQEKNVKGYFDLLPHTKNMPGTDTLMESNPAFRSLMGTAGQYAGQKTENARQFDEGNALGWHNANTSRYNAETARMGANEKVPTEEEGLAAAMEKNVAETQKSFKVTDNAARAWFMLATKLSQLRGDSPGLSPTSGDRWGVTEAHKFPVDEAFKLRDQVLGNTSLTGGDKEWLDAMIESVVGDDAQKGKARDTLNRFTNWYKDGGTSGSIQLLPPR